MPDDSDDVRALQAELAAAREIISTLKGRIEADAQVQELDRFAVRKAMANLENTVAQRTRDLTASEARYRALFEHGPDMTLMVDERGMVTDVNQTTASALARPVSSLVDVPLRSLFQASSAEAAAKLVGRGNGTELELVLDDGRVVDATAASVPDYHVTQLVLRDVTSRVELTRALDHARRLAAIGRLAAGVAHEINNPLAVLKLAISLFPELTDVEQVHQIREMGGHVDRIARIVENLQTFASPRAPARETVAVVDIVETALRVSETALHDVEVQVDVDPPELAFVADFEQVVQVVVNLLTNAARATGSGGVVQLRGRRAGASAILEVIDDGPGIPDQILSDVFAPFVTSNPHLGSGLGLSITWGLVQENGGEIEAMNMPNGGACMRIELPAALGSATRSTAPMARSDPPSQIGLTVLCVEDEPNLLYLLERFLENLGHAPLGVATAEEGLGALEAAQVDVLITDARLPGMSGEDLLARLAVTHPELRRRAIVMSGMFLSVEELEPSVVFLQKPFGLKELRAALADLPE